MQTPYLLRTARLRAGLSVRAAARATGIDAGALSRYENGRKTPRSDTVEHVLKRVGYELEVRPRRSSSARFVDALCEHQARAILDDPALVERARGEMSRLEGRSASYETWTRTLDAGALACVAVLTSSSEAVRQLKADSPFAYVVDLADEGRQRLLEAAHAT
jgi:transcriptional regulator with XRE-family HTH domain